MDSTALKMRMESLNRENIGKIIVKEYPSYELTAPLINSFLDTLRNTKGIEKPILFVDYLQLMSSSRLKPGAVNSYEYIKSITAELRSVSQKRKIPIFTASQLNRSAINNLEAGSESVADSMGINAFADCMIFMLQTPVMKEQGELLVKFEKNRYSGITRSLKMGFDYSKMRFEDRFFSENFKQKPDTSLSTETSESGDDFGNFSSDIFKL
jgi:replicative DNA helicase